MSKSNFSTVLDAAAIPVDEAAKLFKVSRVTIYHWREGNIPNQSIILDRYTRLLAGLEKAVAAGDLPAPDVSREVLYDTVIEMLRKHLKQ